MADLVTLETAQNFLRLKNPTGADNDTLTLIIGWASARIEHELSTIASQAITETVTSTGGSFILARTPVQTLTSVTAVTTGAPTVEVTDLQVMNSLGGVVSPIGGAIPDGVYTVVYTAGRAETPTGVDGACLALIRHWWNQSQAHSSATYGDPTFVPDFKDLPNTVRNMLGVVSPVSGLA